MTARAAGLSSPSRAPGWGAGRDSARDGTGSRGDGKQLPFAWDPLQGVPAAVVELDTRSRHQVANGTGDEHLTGAGEAADARPDVHGDAGEVVAAGLALSRVQPGPHLEPDVFGLVSDRLRTSDRPGRSIEGRQKPVASRFHLLAVEPLQLAAHGRVVGIEHVVPTSVAQAHGPFGRAHDVREHDRLEYPVDPALLAASGKNSSISSRTSSSAPVALSWKSPGYSENRAPRMCSAR